MVAYGEKNIWSELLTSDSAAGRDSILQNAITARLSNPAQYYGTQMGKIMTREITA
jgi:hypothetical protein